MPSHDSLVLRRRCCELHTRRTTLVYRTYTYIPTHTIILVAGPSILEMNFSFIEEAYFQSYEQHTTVPHATHAPRLTMRMRPSTRQHMARDAFILGSLTRYSFM